MVAAKEPSPEIIAACEAKYREIFRQHGKEHEIQFPKHYPTSALVGSVDVVDVVSYDTLSTLPIPETVCYTLYSHHSILFECCFSGVQSFIDHSGRGGGFLCLPVSKLSRM